MQLRHTAQLALEGISHEPSVSRVRADPGAAGLDGFSTDRGSAMDLPPFSTRRLATE